MVLVLSQVMAVTMVSVLALILVVGSDTGDLDVMTSQIIQREGSNLQQ
jgi:hypothetical protein